MTATPQGAVVLLLILASSCLSQEALDESLTDFDVTEEGSLDQGGDDFPNQGKQLHARLNLSRQLFRYRNTGQNPLGDQRRFNPANAEEGFGTNSNARVGSRRTLDRFRKPEQQSDRQGGSSDDFSGSQQSQFSDGLQFSDSVDGSSHVNIDPNEQDSGNQNNFQLAGTGIPTNSIALASDNVANDPLSTDVNGEEYVHVVEATGSNDDEHSPILNSDSWQDEGSSQEGFDLIRDSAEGTSNGDENSYPRVRFQPGINRGRRRFRGQNRRRLMRLRRPWFLRRKMILEAQRGNLALDEQENFNSDQIIESSERVIDPSTLLNPSENAQRILLSDGSSNSLDTIGNGNDEISPSAYSSDSQSNAGRFREQKSLDFETSSPRVQNFFRNNIAQSGNSGNSVQGGNNNQIGSFRRFQNANFVRPRLRRPSFDSTNTRTSGNNERAPNFQIEQNSQIQSNNRNEEIFESGERRTFPGQFTPNRRQQSNLGQRFNSDINQSNRNRYSYTKPQEFSNANQEYFNVDQSRGQQGAGEVNLYQNADALTEEQLSIDDQNQRRPQTFRSQFNSHERLSQFQQQIESKRLLQYPQQQHDGNSPADQMQERAQQRQQVLEEQRLLQYPQSQDQQETFSSDASLNYQDDSQTLQYPQSTGESFSSTVSDSNQEDSESVLHPQSQGNGESFTPNLSDNKQEDKHLQDSNSQAQGELLSTHISDNSQENSNNLESGRANEQKIQYPKRQFELRTPGQRSQRPVSSQNLLDQYFKPAQLTDTFGPGRANIFERQRQQTQIQNRNNQQTKLNQPSLSTQSTRLSQAGNNKQQLRFSQANDIQPTSLNQVGNENPPNRFSQSDNSNQVPQLNLADNNNQAVRFNENNNQPLRFNQADDENQAIRFDQTEKGNNQGTRFSTANNINQATGFGQVQSNNNQATRFSLVGNDNSQVTRYNQVNDNRESFNPEVNTHHENLNYSPESGLKQQRPAQSTATSFDSFNDNEPLRGAAHSSLQGIRKDQLTLTRQQKQPQQNFSEQRTQWPSNAQTSSGNQKPLISEEGQRDDGVRFTRIPGRVNQLRNEQSQEREGTEDDSLMDSNRKEGSSQFDQFTNSNTRFTQNNFRNQNIQASGETSINDGNNQDYRINEQNNQLGNNQFLRNENQGQQSNSQRIQATSRPQQGFETRFSQGNTYLPHQYNRIRQSRIGQNQGGRFQSRTQNIASSNHLNSGNTANNNQLGNNNVEAAIHDGQSKTRFQQNPEANQEIQESSVPSERQNQQVAFNQPQQYSGRDRSISNQESRQNIHSGESLGSQQSYLPESEHSPIINSQFSNNNQQSSASSTIEGDQQSILASEQEHTLFSEKHTAQRFSRPSSNIEENRFQYQTSKIASEQQQQQQQQTYQTSDNENAAQASLQNSQQSFNRGTIQRNLENERRTSLEQRRFGSNAESPQRRNQLSSIQRHDEESNRAAAVTKSDQSTTSNVQTKISNAHGQPGFTYQRNINPSNSFLNQNDEQSISGSLRGEQQFSDVPNFRSQNQQQAQPSSEALRQAQRSDISNTRLRYETDGHRQSSASATFNRGNRKFLDTFEGLDSGEPQKKVIERIAAVLQGKDYLADQVDYPKVPRITGTPRLTEIPNTGFRCEGRVSGYYADSHEMAKCQSFHFCGIDGTKISYLCPTGTAFNQRLLVCDHMFRVECSTSADYYYVNERLYGANVHQPLQEESRAFRSFGRRT